MKHTTEYLYGIKPAAFAEMPYLKALAFKKEAARALVESLIVPHYSVRDDERVHAALSAIRFNEKLMEEMGT